MTKHTLIFHVVRYKNFMATGNQFTEISLDGYKVTRVLGKTGSGKSTLVEAIFYALFNKPFRDIKLTQLINSINNKNMVVEIEFSILGNRYKVIRGQKPAIFEIYKNGVLETQEGDSRDYQRILETQIIRANAKTFKQLVVIGSASYKQFMELKPPDRRDIIEDILEISIFTKMGDLSRSIERTLKADLNKIDSEIKLRQETCGNQKTLISKLEDEKDAFLQNHSKMLLGIEQKLQAALEEELATTATLKKLRSSEGAYKQLTDAILKASSQANVIASKVSSISDDRDKLKAQKSCNVCGQGISDGHKEMIILDYDAKLEENQQKHDKLAEIITGLKDKVSGLDYDADLISTNESSLAAIRANISQYQSQLASLGKVADKFSGLESTKQMLLEETEKLCVLSDNKVKYSTDLMYYNVISTMLKDTGIKATIVDNVLPIINKFINKYLEEFDLFVGFELSNTFEETIRSRDRDCFSYASFSEGEKTKIDLSILLTWRKLAAAKNAISTNLLILDEVGSSTLDSDVYTDILNTLFSSASNVFSISHRDQDPELFDRIITVTKPKNFSIITEETNGTTS